MDGHIVWLSTLLSTYSCDIEKTWMLTNADMNNWHTCIASCLSTSTLLSTYNCDVEKNMNVN